MQAPPLCNVPLMPKKTCIEQAMQRGRHCDPDLEPELKAGLMGQLRGCGTCGDLNHKVRKDGRVVCTVFLNQLLHLERGRAAPEMCTYEICDRKTEHITHRCTALHGSCKRCRLRGHFEGSACRRSLDDLRKAFDDAAHLGRITSQREKYLQTGFFAMERNLDTTGWLYTHLMGKDVYDTRRFLDDENAHARAVDARAKAAADRQRRTSERSSGSGAPAVKTARVEPPRPPPPPTKETVHSNAAVNRALQELARGRNGERGGTAHPSPAGAPGDRRGRSEDRGAREGGSRSSRSSSKRSRR